MADDVVSLSTDVLAIRRIVGSDPDDYALLLTLASVGEIPATKTKSGGYMISRKDLPLITSIFNALRRK